MKISLIASLLFLILKIANANNVVFVGTEKGDIQIWNKDTTQLIGFLQKVHGFKIDFIKLLKDGRHVVTSSEDSLVKVWRLNDDNAGVSPVCTINLVSAAATQIDQLDDGRLVLALFRRIEFYEPTTCSRTNAWDLDRSISFLKVLPLNSNTNKQFLTVSTADGYFSTWNTTSGVAEFEGPTNLNIDSFEASERFVWAGAKLTSEILVFRNSRRENFSLFDTIYTQTDAILNSVNELRLFDENAQRTRLISVKNKREFCVWTFKYLPFSYKQDICLDTPVGLEKVEVVGSELVLNVYDNGNIQFMYFNNDDIFQRVITIGDKVSAIAYVPKRDSSVPVTTQSSSSSSSSGSPWSTGSWSWQPTTSSSENNNNNNGSDLKRLIKIGILVTVVLLSLIISMLLVLICVNCCRK